MTAPGVTEPAPPASELAPAAGQAAPGGGDPAPAHPVPPAAGHPLCTHVATDERGVVLSVDPSFAAILGWTPAEIVGRRIGELVHRDDLQRGLASWARLRKSPGAAGPGMRLRYQHREGRWVWMEVTNRNRLDDPRHHDIAGEMVDVTAEIGALEAVAVRDQLLDQATEVAALGLFHAGTDGRLVHVNRQLVEMTGTTGAATLGEQLSGLADGDRPRLRAAVQGATGGASTGVEIGVTVATGSVRRWSVSLRPVRDVTGTITGITGCVSDVTGDLTSTHAARSSATTDPLTGCLTRDATVAALGELIGRHRPPVDGAPQWAAAGAPTGSGAGTRRGGGGGRGTAVLVIAIEGVRAISEHLGQPAGDELLTVVALRIIDSVRASDVVGRTGLDQFAVLCGGVPGPTTALTIGRQTLEQVCQPVELKAAGGLTVRANMGVSWSNRSGADAAEMLAEAEGAVVASKETAATEPLLAAF